jgi:hypothetical protein
MKRYNLNARLKELTAQLKEAEKAVLNVSAPDWIKKVEERNLLYLKIDNTKKMMNNVRAGKPVLGYSDTLGFVATVKEN